REIDAVLFDKTGTLTKGEPKVLQVEPRATSASNSDAGPEVDDTDVDNVDADDVDADSVLALAAAAETDSEHPLARAIVSAAEERGLSVPQAHDFTSSPAVGVTATVDGHEVRVGGPALLDE